MSETTEHDTPSPGSLLDAAPGIARIAAGASLRTAQWTLGVYVRAGNRVAQAALSGESAGELLRDVGDGLRGYARTLLGVADLDERLRGLVPDGVARAARGEDSEDEEQPARRNGGRPAEPSLRDRGAELLRRSADVRDDEEAHPAYERILGELAPDEARILRFLALEGPQPSVDVRATKALAVSSQLVAPGISMIGAGAGCRYMDRVPAYLNNLYRLGLIWFSREALENPLRYQVLEAQPEVIEALRSGGRGKTVRRSIHLTPFGEDFCRVCLPLQTAEIDALPGGAADGTPLEAPTESS